MSSELSYVFKAQLLSAVIYIVGIVACLACAFMFIRWNRVKQRYILMAITIVFGIGAIVGSIYVFNWTINEQDKAFESFAGFKANDMPTKPMPLNTYYIERLKKLTPDSIKAQAPEEFYTYYGHDGAWRFPLVYPFDIRASDIYFNCSLSYEDPANVSREVMPYIDKFNFDKTFFIAKTESPDAAINFWVYNFWTGQKIECITLEDCIDKAKSMGYKGEPKLITIKEYSVNFIGM